MSEKRDRIIKALRELIKEKGFSRITTDELAKRAEVAKGTLYVYFKSKEEMLTAILDEEYDRIYRTLCEIVNDSGKEVLEKIDNFVFFFLSYMQENKDFYHSLMLEAPSIREGEFKKVMMQKLKALHELILKILKEAQQQDIIRKDLPDEVLLAALVGTVNRLTYLLVSSNYQGNFLDFKPYLLEVIFNGIKRR